MKKLIAIICLGLVSLFSGCANTSDKNDEIVSTIESAVLNEDEELLFSVFSQTAVDELGESTLRGQIQELFSLCDRGDISFSYRGSYTESSKKAADGSHNVQRTYGCDLTVDGVNYFFTVGDIIKSSASDSNCGIYNIEIACEKSLDENGESIKMFEHPGLWIRE